MTELIRRSKEQESGGLRSELDRFFADTFMRGLPFAGSQGERGYPAIDIYSDENKFVLVADLPGYSSDDVEINVTSNQITLSGKTKSETEKQEDTFYWKERYSGSFSRSFELPIPVQSGKVEASFEDGVLKVEMPKADDARPRTVKIKKR